MGVPVDHSYSLSNSAVKSQNGEDSEKWKEWKVIRLFFKNYYSSWHGNAKNELVNPVEFDDALRFAKGLNKNKA